MSYEIKDETADHFERFEQFVGLIRAFEFAGYKKWVSKTI